MYILLLWLLNYKKSFTGSWRSYCISKKTIGMKRFLCTGSSTLQFCKKVDKWIHAYMHIEEWVWRLGTFIPNEWLNCLSNLNLRQTFVKFHWAPDWYYNFIKKAIKTVSQVTLTFVEIFMSTNFHFFKFYYFYFILFIFYSGFPVLGKPPK